MRSKLLCLLFTVALLAAPLRSAFAAWPEKPIRMIVPSAPGGAPDVLMRALCDQLAHQLGVAIIIDNKPGGSYVIGTSELVRAAPDGYTLAYGNIVSLATNRSLLASVPYDVDRDLTLVSMTWRVVNMIVVNSNLPVLTVPELVAYARKSPGRLAFASDGNGTTAHLGMELFKSMTGTYMLHVPYRGAVSGLADVMAGGVQVMMANTPVVAPHVESGKLRALGITSPKRSAAYPDLPAVAESIPGFEVTAWGGIVAPANLPADIVNRLNAEIRVALASSAVLERFQKLGAEAVASTPEEFRELSRRETAKWARVIKASGAKLD